MYKKVLILLFFIPFQLLFAQTSMLKDFPEGSTPEEIGKRLAYRFLTEKHALHVGKWIGYPETFYWNGALRYRKSLRGGEKYYLADPGIRFARNTDTRVSYGPSLENALYTHLRSKDYDVSVGTIGKLECDFIVRKRNQYAYIQVSMSVQDPQVEEREYRPFSKLADGYPKYLFTLDPLPLQRDGVRHLNLMEFLQNDGDIDFD